MEKYFKVLDVDGACYFGGKGRWSLPHDGQPGEWMPRINGALRFCSTGYHVLSANQLIAWLGPAIFECEVAEIEFHDDTKHICRSARLVRKVDSWDKKTMRLFAAECANRALPIFEQTFPNDNSARLAIQSAREFAEGKIRIEGLIPARTALKDIIEAATQEADKLKSGDDPIWDTAFDAGIAAGKSALRAANWDAYCSNTEAAVRCSREAIARDRTWRIGWSWGFARMNAWHTAWNAEKQWQGETLLRLLGI